MTMARIVALSPIVNVVVLDISVTKDAVGVDAAATYAGVEWGYIPRAEETVKKILATLERIEPDIQPIGTKDHFIVTVIGLVAVVPAESIAIAVTVCEPLAEYIVFHRMEYGVVVTFEPKFIPSI